MLREPGVLARVVGATRRTGGISALVEEKFYPAIAQGSGPDRAAG